MAFAGLLLLAAVIALFGLVSVPACMCAPPPPGSHPVMSPKTITEVLGPPLSVFLVGGYLALAPKEPRRRMIAIGFVLVLTASAAAISMNVFLPCCGEWAL